MFIELLIAILLGVFAGIFTGLIPGIHINLVAISTLTLTPFLLNYLDPITIAVFIISMAITHSFLDFIPSIFLGAPETETALSVLPGHKLLLEGKAYEAIKLTVIGSLCGLIIAISLVPFFLITLWKIYSTIKEYIAYLLIFTSLLLIIKDKQKHWALITFSMAGALGISVLRLVTLKQPLFPLLSGLFGTSALLLSYSQKTKIPKQEITQTNLKKKTIIKSLISSLIAGSICSFMPGLGPAQAAILGSQLLGKIKERGFLILVGSLGIIDIIISFVTLYTLNRARNGAIVAVSQIVETFNFNHLLIFLGSSLIAGAIATVLALQFGKIFSKIITKINYQKLCLIIISLITVLVLFFSGPLGLFVLFISTMVGLIPQLTNTGRNHLMGCLILPVIIFFLLY